MTNHIDVVYAKNKIEMAWAIGSGMVCDENEIR